MFGNIIFKAHSLHTLTHTHSIETHWSAHTHTHTARVSHSQQCHLNRSVIMCYLQDHLPFRDMKKLGLNICPPEVVSLINTLITTTALRERESNRERKYVCVGDM